jgi:hypothetical protein
MKGAKKVAKYLKMIFGTWMTKTAKMMEYKE